MFINPPRAFRGHKLSSWLLDPTANSLELESDNQANRNKRLGAQGKMRSHLQLLKRELLLSVFQRCLISFRGSIVDRDSLRGRVKARFFRLAIIMVIERSARFQVFLL